MQQLSRFRCQRCLAEPSQCLVKAMASKTRHKQEMSWAHLSGTFTVPPVRGIEFTPASLSLAERYLVALDHILISSEFLFPAFLCPQR